MIKKIKEKIEIYKQVRRLDNFTRNFTVDIDMEKAFEGFAEEDGERIAKGIEDAFWKDVKEYAESLKK